MIQTLLARALCAAVLAAVLVGCEEAVGPSAMVEPEAEPLALAAEFMYVWKSEWHAGTVGSPVSLKPRPDCNECVTAEGDATVIFDGSGWLVTPNGVNPVLLIETENPPPGGGGTPGGGGSGSSGGDTGGDDAGGDDTPPAEPPAPPAEPPAPSPPPGDDTPPADGGDETPPPPASPPAPPGGDTCAKRSTKAGAWSAAPFDSAPPAMPTLRQGDNVIPKDKDLVDPCDVTSVTVDESARESVDLKSWDIQDRRIGLVLLTKRGYVTVKIEGAVIDPSQLIPDEARGDEAKLSESPFDLAVYPTATEIVIKLAG